MAEGSTITTDALVEKIGEDTAFTAVEFDQEWEAVEYPTTPAVFVQAAFRRCHSDPAFRARFIAECRK